MLAWTQTNIPSAHGAVGSPLRRSPVPSAVGLRKAPSSRTTMLMLADGAQSVDLVDKYYSERDPRRQAEVYRALLAGSSDARCCFENVARLALWPLKPVDIHSSVIIVARSPDQLASSFLEIHLAQLAGGRFPIRDHLGLIP